MKSTHAIASVVAAAAVLLAAYAVGLLIRSVRMKPQSAPVKSTEPIPKHTRQPTPEERAKAKDAKAAELEKNRNRTEEQKGQFRNQIASRLGGPNEPNAPPSQGRRAPQRIRTGRTGGALPAQAPADANGRPSAGVAEPPTPANPAGTSTRDSNSPN